MRRNPREGVADPCKLLWTHYAQSKLESSFGSLLSETRLLAVECGSQTIWRPASAGADRNVREHNQ